MRAGGAAALPVGYSTANGAAESPLDPGRGY